MKKFDGIFPALLTPFTESGKINHSALRELVELNIAKGVTGFYVCGSTGEAFMLSSAERKSILETVVDQVAGRCCVFAHIGHISCDAAIDLAKHADSLHVDAISSVAPFYYNFSFEEIKNYYFSIVDSVSAPMIVYNFPAFSKVNLSADNIGCFFDDERFVALKNTSSDFFLLERLKKQYPDKSYFNGFDEMFLSGLAAGATGAVGSTYNFMAEKFIKIKALFEMNDIDAAREEQIKANNIISALIKVGLMDGEKAILRMLGLDFGNARSPFHQLNDEEYTYLKSVYEANI